MKAQGVRGHVPIKRQANETLSQNETPEIDEKGYGQNEGRLNPEASFGPQIKILSISVGSGAGIAALTDLSCTVDFVKVEIRIAGARRLDLNNSLPSIFNIN